MTPDYSCSRRFSFNTHSLRNKLNSKEQSKLAIEGGPAALDAGPFPWPVASSEINSNVEQAMADGSWGQYHGRWTDELTATIASQFKTEQVTLCCSGTIAVELALRGAGVQADDEVILAGYDFPGNFRAIEAIGARPVLIDVVEGGWVIDARDLEEALCDQTSAIIVSHLHGQIADIGLIREIIDRHNLDSEKKVTIVEDACQVPGATLAGSPLGCLGDVGVLSFGGSKLLSAGRGGAVLTNSPEIHQRAKIFAQRGNDSFPLSQLQAAVLIPQFATLATMNETRNQNAQKLIQATEQFDSLDGLTQLATNREQCKTAFYKLPWQLRDRSNGWSRADFIAALAAEGLQVGEGFRGFLRRSPRRCRKIGTLVQSQIAAQQTVLLSHPVLLESDSVIDKVIEAIEKVAGNPR